jgi:aminopeptidase N
MCSFFFFFRISPNLKAIIYCTAISYGSEEEWDFAWKMYKMTTVASEKDLLLDALGCSRETWILARLFKNAKNVYFSIYVKITIRTNK